MRNRVWNFISGKKKENERQLKLFLRNYCRNILTLAYSSISESIFEFFWSVFTYLQNICTEQKLFQAQYKESEMQENHESSIHFTVTSNSRSLCFTTPNTIAPMHWVTHYEKTLYRQSENQRNAFRKRNKYGLFNVTCEIYVPSPAQL